MNSFLQNGQDEVLPRQGTMDDQEEWRPITEFQDYEVSDRARVRSLKGIHERILSQRIGNTGYLVVQLTNNGNHYTRYIHRIVAISFIPNPENKTHVDHKNRIATDNRVCNLRWATKQENSFNTKNHIDSSTKFKGVYYCKRRCKYIAKITTNGKQLQLGSFNTPEQASVAYDVKARELQGEFCIN